MDSFLQGITFHPFSQETFWLMLLLTVLLALSALASGSETAFFSLSPSDVKALEDSNSKQSHAALRLLKDEDRLLSTLLIANNLVNIGAILVANSLIDSIVSFGNNSTFEFLVKVIIVTFVLLLAGEITPKIFAAYNSLPLARAMAQPILAMRWFFSPLSYLLIRAGNGITKALSHGRSAGGGFSSEELADAIEIAETDSDDDKKMLTGIVRFGHTEVDEIMKPRIDVVALDIEASFADVRRTVINSGFSRIPVYNENLDTIKGILYVKDLLPHLSAPDDFRWTQLLRPAYFVPEHKKINDLLEDFRSRKIHLAIVVDEYGGTLGIVSLEDVLEEIVGEIADESDRESALYEQIGPHTYLFGGSTHLGDFLRALDLPDDLLDEVRGDSDTIAGVMLEIRGEFFAAGESVEFGDLTFTAQQLEGRRIAKIKVHVAEKHHR